MLQDGGVGTCSWAHGVASYDVCVDDRQGVGRGRQELCDGRFARGEGAGQADDEHFVYVYGWRGGGVEG